MECLQGCIRELSTIEGEEVIGSRIYKCIAHLQLYNGDRSKFYNEIIPQIYNLFENRKIRKEIFFISLLVNKPLLEIFLEYEESTVKLDLKNPKSIFNYVYYNNKHWLLEILDKINEHLEVISPAIQDLFFVLKVICISNSSKINLDELGNFLNRHYSNIDSFLELYIKNANILFSAVKLIRNNIPNTSEIFKLLSKNTLLDTLSQFMDITKPALWTDISTLLAENESFCKENFTYFNSNESDCTEVEIFIAFTVLISIIDCLKCSNNISANGANKDEITACLEVVKEKLINLKNRTLQIELLENIFALIFLRNNDLQSDTPDSFFCGECEVRLILALLKSVFEDLKKLYSNRIFNEFKRFVDLNMYVTDGYWRLELLNSVQKKRDLISVDGESKMDFLCYMLSSPEALICMCLKQNNIEKAIQVVKIFGLEESVLANEIEHSVKVKKLKRDLEDANKKGHTQLTTTLVNNHVTSDTFEPLVNSNSPTIFTNRTTIDILDIIFTVPLEKSILIEIVNKIGDDPENKTLLPSVLKKITNMESIDYWPVTEILQSCNSMDLYRFDDDVKQYNKLAEVYDNFVACCGRSGSGNLNVNHPAHKIFTDIQEICFVFKFGNKEQPQHMQRLLKYLKAFYKILLLEENHTDLISKTSEVSLFEILKYKRVDLISKLVYERHVDGVDFDNIFIKMKLDLTYHIAGCSFPRINLNRSNAGWQAVQLFKPRKDVVGYIQKRNWLLAFMINRIHGIEDEKIDSNEIRIRTLTNLMQLNDVQTLKSSFNDNEVLTALQQDFCNYTTDEEEPVHSNDSFNPILLKLPESNNWKYLYELLLSINEAKIDIKIEKLRDLILCNLVKDKKDSAFYRYTRFIKSRDLRLQIVSEELYHWPGDFCIDIIKSEASISNMNKKIENLCNWCCKIEFCFQIKELFVCDTWFTIHQLCEDNKSEVVEKILGTSNIDMLIKYLDIYLPDENLLLNIKSNYFASVFNRDCPRDKVKTLFAKLPQEHLLGICKNLLKMLSNLEDLRFILDCIKQGPCADEFHAKNVEISLKMMTYFKPNEQHQFLCLMDDPLSILEILLMNTKLEKLSQILLGLQEDIEMEEENETIISGNKIDELLRVYSEKSLDFKVITRPASSNQSESKIMLSIDSLYLEQKLFVMPENVPTKEEWVLDESVTECMCCYQITFSMFNRRHHCRRCGRVICWNCSLQKIHVESYEDILVRVCKDCYKQSQDESSDSDSLKSERSRIYEPWILTDNPEHNAIVREEFSYENAPSVLLCLSIMKYHSKTDLYPRFLLNQCENILTILHPVGTNFQVEVDFNLIISMLKSLAVAAKMVSNQCNLQWGASLADKMISQAEMLGLLAEKGYLHLLAISSRSQNVHVDANVLRLVRDRLLDLEQWNLALEVSTKAGLDTTGVFARWGKSFLKAGNLQMARLKFHMCFEKCAQYETPDYSNLHESYSSLRSSRSLHQSRLSLTSNSRPLKSPLLLNEIIQILESKTERINLKVFKNLPSTKIMYDSTSSLQSNPNTSVRSEDSISIINKLQNLSAIANGNYVFSDMLGDYEEVCGPHMENIFYEECIYYLDKYGSHLSLCQFYVKHNDFRQALEHMAENEIHPDMFMEIYMSCLKEGKINYLQENMIKIDSTLDKWKIYIRHICIYLEKQSMFHSLYQLQQFIGDFVRAAMTCIKFYSQEVTSFEEFYNRVEYLQNAQKHLEQELEQEQWVDVQSVGSFKSNETYEEKSIANPALVMKLNSKDIHKHINTIKRQVEVVNFLARCEKVGVSVVDILAANSTTEPTKLPTLFGSIFEKMQLAILCIVTGENVEDGFGMAYRIIQDYKLKAVKVYCQSGRVLAKANRPSGIPSLVKCIRSSGENDAVVTEMCDEMLALTARTLGDSNATDKQLEDIIKHISNRTIKINSYIETKQLRSAFLLAAKFSKVGDIRRISREAELYNRPDVKKLCQKYLHIQEHAATSKNDSK